MIHILFQNGSNFAHIFQQWVIENVKIWEVNYELVCGGKKKKRLV